jgi:hypothetical protein
MHRTHWLPTRLRRSAAGHHSCAPCRPGGPHLARAVALLLATGACGDFEDPSLVLDLRVLGMRSEPPEVMIDPAVFTPGEQPSFDFVPAVQVCALLADPAEPRRLVWTMRMCPRTRSRRCDEPDEPTFPLGSGVIDDPDEGGTGPCASITAGPDLLMVGAAAVGLDELGGFGSIAVQVELRVQPEAAPPETAVYAAKAARYAAQIPAERTANRNPGLDGILGRRGEEDAGGPLPPGRCGQTSAPEVTAGERIELAPIEAAGARESYLLPTFDGRSRAFVENLRYAWYATAGSWSRDTTGGPKDAVGNEPPLDTAWTAPSDPTVVGDGLDVQLWVVQRDERGGVSWYESCVRVVP